jgi:hypothetical protein
MRARRLAVRDRQSVERSLAIAHRGQSPAARQRRSPLVPIQRRLSGSNRSPPLGSVRGQATRAASEAASVSSVLRDKLPISMKAWPLFDQ